MTLDKSEQKRLILFFISKILQIEIKNQKLFQNANSEVMVFNSSLTIEEIQKETGIKETTFREIARKFYIMNIGNIIKEKYGSTKQIPVVSFSGNSNVINLLY